jgi:hypothetical protein
MITGETLTAAVAVKKYGMDKLVDRQCVVATVIYGNGAVSMTLGEIVDPSDCVIDEPDGSALYVQYWSVDDWYLTGVAPDEQIVLLEVVE